ncbi:mediator of RNA polymerase II transcription subunit 27 [Diachasma alloeum]|uniref:mediator of RNA polymerase II transcription subunit 27 n=1 Tax=Diachasma alloeum TaxID=454923 RepID=UPI00073831A6|nr:mediator of RNA polymerase II transcription subunit 27 [Diachasma alloeum]
MDHQQLQHLNNALTAVRVLRSSVRQVFDSVANGLTSDHGDENKDSKYLSELQELLVAAHSNLRDVEAAVGTLNPPSGPFSLGSTTYLSQETSQERQALYSTLVNSYKWCDKAHEYSNVAHVLLSQNSLKRSYINTSSRSKRGRIQTSTHNVSPAQVDAMFSTLDRLSPDMTITITRPFASNAILNVTMGHILKGAIAFKGLMVEWVIVKGYGEKMDLWTESRHKVFRQMTETAQAGMLHFHSPTMPEYAVRSFMTWFGTFANVFSQPCKRCGLHLHNAMPPTWREFRSLEPFHQECKP